MHAVRLTASNKTKCCSQAGDKGRKRRRAGGDRQWPQLESPVGPRDVNGLTQLLSILIQSPVFVFVAVLVAWSPESTETMREPQRGR